MLSTRSYVPAASYVIMLKATTYQRAILGAKNKKKTSQKKEMRNRKNTYIAKCEARKKNYLFLLHFTEAHLRKSRKLLLGQ